VQIFGYAVALAASALALAFTSVGGPVTLAVAVGVNALFLLHCWRLMQRGAVQAQQDRYLAEKKAFGVSILYLFALFGAVAADAVVPTPAAWPVLF
jgi:protoheme IX farnesyltransferase